MKHLFLLSAALTFASALESTSETHITTGTDTYGHITHLGTSEYAVEVTSTWTGAHRSTKWPSQYNTACNFHLATANYDTKACPPTDTSQYLDDICRPGQDLNAPCNVLQRIKDDCRYDTGGSSVDYYPQTNETNRVCICQSQLGDMMAGCMASYRAHGGTEGHHWWPRDFWGPIMRNFCDAASPPQQYDWIQWLNTRLLEGSRVVTDPLMGKTDVSLYFTPSLTGTANLVVMPTEGAATWLLDRASGMSRTYKSSNVVDGQIVATAALVQQQESEAVADASASAAVEGSPGAEIDARLASALAFAMLGIML